MEYNTHVAFRRIVLSNKSKKKNNKNTKKNAAIAATNIKREKHYLRYLFILVIIATGLVLGVDMLVLHTGGSALTSEDALDSTFDCALVLGASVNADGEPSPMLRDRLDKGIELYQNGQVNKLLFSGDNGQTEYNEVEAMKRYALEKGVEKKDIFLDHAGFSTYESVYRAKAIFNVESAVIVTQQYHEYRALYIAKKLGLYAVGVPCEPVEYKGQSYRDFREILARDKDFAKCIFKPEPTYLGDVIDIKGDGRASWS